MPAASIPSIIRAISRGDIDPVYYVTGDEDVLKGDLSQAVTNLIEPANRDFNLDIRSAGDLDGESLHVLIETPPMLSDRRVAIVKNVEQWRKNSKPWRTLLRYVAAPSPTTTLVLIHGAGHKPDDTLSENSTHVTADPLDPDTMREWIIARAESVGISLEPEAAEHLLVAVAGSLSVAATEVEKLAAATVENRPVGVAEVEKLVGVRHGETLSDWVQAVLHRETARSVKMLDIVLPQSGMTGVKMLMSLGTALIGTRYVRALLDDGTDASRVTRQAFDHLRRYRPAGIGRYSEEVAAWVEAAHRWTGGDLDNALCIVHEADEQLKSSTVSDSRGTILSMLLLLTTSEG